MAVTYRRWDADDSVSSQWFTVLDAARKAGVSFLLNDGHRTMAQQQVLFEQSKHGGPLAAFPSATAPHIRTGRPDHALDVNARDGGAGRLAAWLRRRGARATFPVPGEAWHIEVPREDLVRLAGTLADPARRLPGEGAALDPHLRRAHASQARGQGPGRRAGAAQRAAPRHDQSAQVDLASRPAVGLEPHAAPCPLPLAARTHPQPRLKETPTMLEFVKGRRPDITAAQIAAVLVAGVPGVAMLLTTFGVGDVDAAQQETLTSALTWTAVLAAVLIGGDAALRSARNLADAKTDAAAMAVGETAPLAPEIDLQDTEVEFEDDDGLPVSDEEEFFAESEIDQLEAGLTADNPDYVSDGR